MCRADESGGLAECQRRGDCTGSQGRYQRQVEEAWREAGLVHPFLFMNDASRGQSPLAPYGSTNMEKLKAMSRKYDPSQRFYTLRSGGCFTLFCLGLSREIANPLAASRYRAFSVKEKAGR